MTDDAFDDLVARLHSRVGLTLKGKWRLDRLLGVGGMACVYEATHRNNKRVAVKMLHPELSMNVAIRQRFLREGYVANSVGHLGAVSVDDDDVTDDGCAFLVMELLQGETLDARWERKGRRLEATEVLALMDQVLETLAAAHTKGIVHRDLKPENLFLTHGGQVKVLDFGIARVKELSASGSHTQTGSLMGTPTFMPPEQARGRWSEVDGSSDIWAVGATMFTLLTGRFVHLSTTVNEALVLAVTQLAPSVGAVGVSLPAEVIGLVDRALAYETNQRWPDATAMQDELRHVYATLTSKPITLLDAIEPDDDDAAVARVESPGLSTPQTGTMTGGVTATKSVIGRSGSSSARGRLRVAAAASGATLLGVLAIANGIRRCSSPSEPLASNPDRATASASALAGRSVPSVAPVGDPGVPPVVPVDRLPVIPVDSAAIRTVETRRKGIESPRPALSAPVASVPDPARVSPAPLKPSAVVADPWAARR